MVSRKPPPPLNDGWKVKKRTVFGLHRVKRWVYAAIFEKKRFRLADRGIFFLYLNWAESWNYLTTKKLKKKKLRKKLKICLFFGQKHLFFGFFSILRDIWARPPLPLPDLAVLRDTMSRNLIGEPPLNPMAKIIVWNPIFFRHFAKKISFCRNFWRTIRFFFIWKFEDFKNLDSKSHYFYTTALAITDVRLVLKIPCQL